MLNLIVLNIDNYDKIVQNIINKIYIKGFEFDNILFYNNNDTAYNYISCSSQTDINIVVYKNNNKLNHNVFIRYEKADEDIIKIISFLEKIYNHTYSSCFLKLFGADDLSLKNTTEILDEVCLNNDIRYKISSKNFDTKIEIVYNDKTPKMVIDNTVRAIAEELESYLYAEDDISLSEQLFNLLKIRCKIISFAESFTCGRVASAIIENSGASAVVHEGIVAYSNLSKELRLGVSRETLYNCGAVSAECCQEMVQGLLNTNKCDIAIATTGIAGPKSDNSKKPVGLCYIGVGMADRIDVYKYNFYGDREQITQTAVNAALFNAIKYLKYL